MTNRNNHGFGQGSWNPPSGGGFGGSGFGEHSRPPYPGGQGQPGSYGGGFSGGNFPGGSTPPGSMGNNDYRFAGSQPGGLGAPPPKRLKKGMLAGPWSVLLAGLLWTAAFCYGVFQLIRVLNGMDFSQPAAADLGLVLLDVVVLSAVVYGILSMLRGLNAGRLCLSGLAFLFVLVIVIGQNWPLSLLALLGTVAMWLPPSNKWFD
ncbi:hypothetical protein [Corynebacterium heidelbergense]|nr:hypothetical protein [Corynebacterium heidelbergense]